MNVANIETQDSIEYELSKELSILCTDDTLEYVGDQTDANVSRLGAEQEGLLTILLVVHVAFQKKND